MFDESKRIPQCLNRLMSSTTPHSLAAARGVCAAALALSLALGSACAQTTLVAASPFAPAGADGAGGTAATPESYELAGSSVQGSDVLVCIFDRQAKRCEWIPVGGDVGGIHVISYDATLDRVVVTVAGTRRELGLRKAVVVAAAPERTKAVTLGVPRVAETPVSTPPPSATSAARDQQEARMLVSDLLEIGVQQRKAYQEARQKAAAATQPGN